MRRVWAWWFLAEQVCGTLTAPKIDAVAADREVEALIRESWLSSCAESFTAKIRAAWLDSTCRVSVRSLTGNRR